MQFFSWILEGLWWIVRYSFPVFYPTDLVSAARGRRWPRWWLHGIILVLIYVGLWLLNDYVFQLPINLPTAWGYVRHVWLPLLFMLIYVLSWLGWWLYKLLIPEEDLSAYPDIDRDWAEAVGALRQVGVDLSDVPLFLVLGKPEGGEETFMHAAFTASQMPSLVKYAPTRSDASVRLYASREAVFVTCAGASLLGRHADLLTEMVETSVGGGGGPNPLEASVAFRTIAPTGGNLEGIQRILRKAWDENRPVTEDEKEEIRLLTAESETQTATSTKKRPSIFKDPDQADVLTDRLKHLCRLVVRERRPHCPINGMLTLVPFAATDSDEDTNQTNLVIQKDLDAAVGVLKLRCPIIALVGDLERATGFREFVKRFPPDQRKQRLGHRHPWLPDLDAGQLIKAMEAEIEWIYQGVLGNWTYKLFHIEDDHGKEDLTQVTASNAQLFLFLASLRERHKRLSRLMSPFLRKPPEAEEPPLLFGGCYVAGTGTGPDEQAFVAGVIHRLVESQNLVAWTREALIEDAELHRYTTYGYIGVAAFSVALLGIGGFLLWK